MNALLVARLRALVELDRNTRARLLAESRLYGDYADEMQQVHRDNAVELAGIVAAHGWPGIALVGDEGCRLAWTIAQHAIGTPDLQRGFLDALESAVAADDAPPRQAAMLADRIRFNEGRPQVYGSVLDWNGRGELDCDIQDPASVDARRAAVGLPPYAESLAENRAAVVAEGGAPPSDFADYRRRANAWARRVGWRSRTCKTR